MSQLPDDRWQFSHLPGTVTGVQVMVRGPAGVLDDGQRLVLTGPFCRSSRMLPASFGLTRQSESQWQATVVDPCYWTPSLPARYRLQIADAAGRCVAQLVEVGLRRLEKRGRHLWLDGRRWVFRAVTLGGAKFAGWAEFQEARMGLVVDRLDAAIGQAASEAGVPLLLRSSPGDWQSRDWQNQWSRSAAWAAVQLVMLPADWSGQREQLTTLAPNVLFVADLTDARSAAVPAWADAVLCPAEGDGLDTIVRQSTDLPVLALRRRDTTEAADVLAHALAARAACEHFQRDLAPRFDLSGYIVG